MNLLDRLLFVGVDGGVCLRAVADTSSRRALALVVDGVEDNTRVAGRKRSFGRPSAIRQRRLRLAGIEFVTSTVPNPRSMNNWDLCPKPKNPNLLEEQVNKSCELGNMKAGVTSR